MTTAPADLAEVRGWLVHRLDLMPGVARGQDLEPGEVGIVGDPAHASSGGYHEGRDDLTRVGRASSDYSVIESSRDRFGLSTAASALDVGEFDATLPDGRRVTLRSLSAALVDACRRGDPRTRDVREVIWSPDGVTVSRWDRLRLRTTGDSSHRWHTHISMFRDSEGRRHRSDNLLGLLMELVDGPPQPAPASTTPKGQSMTVLYKVAGQPAIYTDEGHHIGADAFAALTKAGVPVAEFATTAAMQDAVRMAPAAPVVDTAAIVAQVVEQLRGELPTAEQVVEVLVGRAAGPA